MTITISDITPRQALSRFHEQLGLTDADLSAAFGVSPRTLSRWRRGEAYPQHDARKMMNEILALADALEESFETTDAARHWMRAESRYLSRMTPAEAVRAGRADRALLAITALEAGVYL